jgi:hypothetical protein
MIACAELLRLLRDQPLTIWLFATVAMAGAPTPSATMYTNRRSSGNTTFDDLRADDDEVSINNKEAERVAECDFERLSRHNVEGFQQEAAVGTTLFGTTQAAGAEPRRPLHCVSSKQVLSQSSTFNWAISLSSPLWAGDTDGCGEGLSGDRMCTDGGFSASDVSRIHLLMEEDWLPSTAGMLFRR